MEEYLQEQERLNVENKVLMDKVKHLEDELDASVPVDDHGTII